MGDSHQMSSAETFEDPLSNYEPASYSSALQRVLAEEPVSEVPSKPFAQVEADACVGDAVKVLHDAQVSSLLVMENGKLVGIFTERDVLESVAERFSRVASASVREVMTCDPTVVYECDPVGTALEAVAVAGHRHVPVLSLDGTPIGVISPCRLLRFLETYLDADADAVH